MALTVQTVANAMNTNVRHYFGKPTADLVNADFLAIFLTYINQAQQDVFHSTIWKKHLLTSESFTSQPDGSPYVLNANNIREVLSVHDLKNRMTLIPFHATPMPQDRFAMGQETSGLQPKYFEFETCLNIDEGDATITQGIHLIPDPRDAAHSGSIRYYYTKTVPIVTSSTDELLLPEDGKDLLVAAGSMYLSKFIGEDTDAQFWTATYERLRAS